MYCSPAALDYILLNPAFLNTLECLSISSAQPHDPAPGDFASSCQKVSKMIALAPLLQDMRVKTMDHGVASLLADPEGKAIKSVFHLTTLSITLGRMRGTNGITPPVLTALTTNLTCLELMLDDKIRGYNIFIWEAVECLWTYMVPKHLVNLHTLRTNYLSLIMMERLALVEYVPKLRVLSIVSPPDGNGRMQPCAERFFGDVVPALAERKLERLDVCVTMSPYWLFGCETVDRMVELIRKLDRLVYLGISILSYNVLDTDERGYMVRILPADKLRH